jgi:glycosyltransferase involved in cell wall biosynthesis
MAANARPEGIDLSIVVPVYNAEKHLPILVHQVFGLNKLGVKTQMICIDDASTDQSADVLKGLASQYPELKLLEEQGNSGAGIARNSAWPHIKGRYCIFFDADDVLHEETISNAISDLDADTHVDIAMFAYRYERDETAMFTDMANGDQQIFKSILRGMPSATGRLENMASLLTFTNYPWNKIIRTAHYKKEGLRFGKTKVNNDILGHWYSLLLARKIMIRDEIICTHIVHPMGDNITNKFGPERLQMFDALSETYALLDSHPDLRRRYAHHFWGLVNNLVKWARPRIESTLLTEFEQCYANLLEKIDLGDLARMRSKHAPELANALVNKLIR